eukprot:2835704-Rhodomonas_salina.1
MEMMVICDRGGGRDGHSARHENGIGAEGAAKIAEALPSLGQLQTMQLVRGGGGRRGRGGGIHEAT